MERTLILNASYEPLQIISWRRAIRLLFQGKVEVVAEYDREIRSVSLAVKLPSVIRLTHYVKLPPRISQVKFTRANIYARDNYQCQYCGRRLPPHQLTYDHVIPVARGGVKSWENIVTCCIVCNRRKGNRTPEEAGLRLLKAPRAPNGFPHRIRLLLRERPAPESWKDYIFWAVEAS